MLNRLIECVLQKVYKWHRIRYVRYLSKYYTCLDNARHALLCDYYLHKAVKHERRCARIDDIIYSMEDLA